MVTDTEVVAAVHAYRQVRLDAGHMNVHVHAQGMRAALEAAEKIRAEEEHARLIEQNTKAFEEFAAPVPPDGLQAGNVGYCPVPRCILPAGHGGGCDEL